MSASADETTFDRLLAEAETRPLVGWDLTLDGRISFEPMPWDFAEIVATKARISPDLLDMDTGGGEWLSRLSFRPPRTVAIEGWPPNIPVAGRRLRPLGIGVVGVDGAPGNAEEQDLLPGGHLPFPDGSFHLISNRHGSFRAGEIARVLSPGGHFLTQQVVGDADDDFYDLLDLPVPARTRPQWTLSLAISQVEAAGLTVSASGEATPRTTFADIGAFAWYVRVLPWTVPGFTIAAHRNRLAQLHAQIANSGPLVIRLPHFWLDAVQEPDDATKKFTG